MAGHWEKRCEELAASQEDAYQTLTELTVDWWEGQDAPYQALPYQALSVLTLEAT
jgi:hypothetical protein